MLVDEIEIIFKAGDGGPGKVSFFPGKKSGPDGGNGGDGGNVIVRANRNLRSLNNFAGKHQLSAQSGEPGGKNNRTGATGDDLIVDLPVGTLLKDKDTDEDFELTEDGQQIPICRSGKGGKGNSWFKSPTNTTPMSADTGKPGQKRNLKIIVRMIADFGLIGLPNAGKSSLLNELTHANVKVASYPFTTLEPNLGALDNKIIADIPGLIEGASKGKGLGINFLKHIEKVTLLIHCVSSQSEDVARDYKSVMRELGEYNPQLTQKEQIILLTKSDLSGQKDLDKKLKSLKKLQKDVLPVSIHDFDSLERLKVIFLPQNTV